MIIEEGIERLSEQNMGYVNDMALFHTDFFQLSLTVRSRNCLLAEGITEVECLIEHSRELLLRFPNMGKKSVAEIETALEAVDLSLAEHSNAVVSRYYERQRG